MAEDTRDPDNVSHDKQIEDATKLHYSPPPAKNPKHEFPKSQVGKLWDVFGNPEEPINLFSERTHNTAGGKSKDITLTDMIKSMSLQDFSSFHKAPCARDSLLLGLGAGFGVGGVRGILGGLSSIWPACNWAVGTFAIASIVAHELCQRRRVKEINGMKQAVELMQELKIQKQKEKEQKKAAEEAARLAEAEVQKRKNWTNLSNYKFW